MAIQKKYGELLRICYNFLIQPGRGYMKGIKSITIDFGDFIDISRGTAFPANELPSWISQSVDEGIVVYATLKGLNGNQTTFSVSHETNWLRLRPID